MKKIVGLLSITLLCGCEPDASDIYLSSEEASIRGLEQALIERQREEFRLQMGRQEEAIVRTEKELAKLERQNYLKSLRLELLKMKDESSQELRERLAESRAEKAELEDARRNLFWAKEGRIQRLKKMSKMVGGADGEREQIQELGDALLELKTITARVKQLEDQAGTIIQPKVEEVAK